LLKKFVIGCVPVSIFFEGLLFNVMSLLLVALRGFLLELVFDGFRGDVGLLFMGLELESLTCFEDIGEASAGR
jgi:hypothetical protein